MNHSQPNGWLYRQFDKLADFIVSLAVLMLVFFIAFMGYRFYEINILFHHALSDLIPDQQSVRIASILIAIVFIFSTVLFMVHARKIDQIFNMEPDQVSIAKLIMAIFALLINLFFWKPWIGPDQAFKGSICIMLASMDYGFAHLFNELRLERKKVKDYQELTEEIAIASDTLQKIRQEFTSLTARAAELKKLIEQHTCPYCEKLFPTPHSINTHKTKCKSRPHV